jgi:1,4-alpha-glucan branching enzyme
MQKKKQTNGNQSKPNIVEVTFALEGDKAKQVYLSGDFNDWSTTAVRMIRHETGNRWERRLMLPPGRYEYKFIVDGEWTADPNSHHEVSNNLGSTNSVVEVGV